MKWSLRWEPIDSTDPLCLWPDIVKKLYKDIQRDFPTDDTNCGGKKAKKQLYVLNDDFCYLLSQLISLEMGSQVYFIIPNAKIRKAYVIELRERLSLFHWCSVWKLIKEKYKCWSSGLILGGYFKNGWTPFLSFFVSPTPDLFLALYIQLKCIWILHLEGWDHIPRILFSSRTYQQALHWNLSCATIVYGHFLINAGRVVVVLQLMRRECLLYLSFFIFLIFRAKLVFFPFWWFSFVSFI